ncbi:MAG: hypothetical protein ABJN84_08030 [Flavobacteriaceae bacterium]
MGNFLNFLIKESFLLAERNLHSKECIEQISKNECIKKSNHYFICSVEKTEFRLKRIKISNSHNIKLRFIIGGKKTKSYTFDLRRLIPGIKFIYLKNNSDNLKISVTNEMNQLFFLEPELFEKEYNINLNNPPNLLYIGKSINVIKRLTKGHHHLNKALSKKDDKTDIRIYFISLKYSYSGLPNPDNQIHYFLGNIDTSLLGISMDSDLMELIERVFIHFFKPKYNELHKNTDIKEDKRLQELIIEKGLNGLIFSYGMKGYAYQFQSDLQPFQAEVITLDTRIQNLTYLPGVHLDLISI